MKSTAQSQNRTALTAQVTAATRIAFAVVFLVAVTHAFSQIAPNDLSQASTCSAIVVHHADPEALFGNGVHVRLNNGAIQTSADRLVWTERPLAIRTFLRGLTFGNGLFVAVGGSYFDVPGVIITSHDSVTWTRRNVPTRSNLYGVTFGNGLFVTVGEQGALFTSANGVVWNRRCSGGTDALLATVTFGNGRFVAGGESGTILTSTNGFHWKRGNLGAPIYVGQITWANGRFLVTRGDEVFSSIDALTWDSSHARPARRFGTVSKSSSSTPH